MILVIDTHGFTTNILVHQLGAAHVVTATELGALKLQDYTHVIVPHGSTALDLSPLRNHPDLPVLAIGAGYQHLAAVYGHTATAPAQPVYGQPVTHRHRSTGLLTGIEQPAELISYHPWRLVDLDSTIFHHYAVDDDGAVLVYRVNTTNHWGMHCDPAALQSEVGSAVLENFLALAPLKPASPPAETLRRPAREHLRVFTRDITGELNTSETFQRLQTDTSAAFWLDSATASRGQGDTTLMGTNTGGLAQTIRWNVETNQLGVLQNGQTSTTTDDVLDYLHRHAWEPPPQADQPGFLGGWVGYLGYEAKQATVPGHRNAHTASTPDAYWIKPQAFLRYNHRTQTTLLVAYANAGLIDELQDALVFGASGAAPHTTTVAGRLRGDWRLSATDYQDRVSDIQQHLATGTAAGVCLTDTYTMPVNQIDGLALYQQLRAHNPAPYAGYLRFNTFGDTLEVLSASPEKFLSVDADGRVESKPIKGTVARSLDPAQDTAVAQQMANDAKIQSENLMITDLLRDDLAKVTEPGTVTVPKLMAVESFAAVHQLVTTVTGQLRAGTSVIDALRAVFPGGSMTGAPKLVSLDMLETLEAGARGIYSGTMGWLGDDHTAELNVVIRSIIIDAGGVTVGAGGAVVIDSDPVEEEHEKQLKARALMEILAEQP